MENVKSAFQKLLKEDFHRFILVITQVVLGFLFFLCIFLPFLKGPEIIKGTVALSEFPGSLIYELILLVAFILFFYLVLVNKNSFAKKVLLIQNIVATLVFLYGVLFYRVGFPASTSGAFGKHLGFIVLILMWFLFFKPGVAMGILQRFVKVPEVTVEPVVEEEIIEEEKYE